MFEGGGWMGGGKTKDFPPVSSVGPGRCPSVSLPGTLHPPTLHTNPTIRFAVRETLYAPPRCPSTFFLVVGGLLLGFSTYLRPGDERKLR